MRDSIQILLEQSLWGQSVGRWLLAGFLLVVVPLVLSFARRTLVRRWGEVAARTETQVDDAAVQVVAATRMWFLVVLGIEAATVSLDLGPDVDRVSTIGALAAVLVQVGIWGALALDFVIGHHFDGRDGDPGRATGASVLRSCRGLRCGAWSRS